VIADHLGLGSVSFDDRLREADAGEWQGMTPDEIDVSYPGFLTDHLRPPTFEKFEHVVERVFAALHDLASTGSPAGGTLLVTTHSGVIRSVVRRLGEVDERIPNVGGVWIDVTPSERSVIDTSDGVELGDRFDPAGILRTGVDAPGEDPGEQADQTDTHRRAQR
jgi:broad specificity phosphatase PhoE